MELQPPVKLLKRARRHAAIVFGLGLIWAVSGHFIWGALQMLFACKARKVSSALVSCHCRSTRIP